MSKLFFITLRVFSATGGIEKVCRVLGKALHETAQEQGGSLEVLSMYDGLDAAMGNAYFSANIFKGFAQAKLRCVLQAVKRGVSKDVLILSHVNLLPIGWLVKKIQPSIKLLLLAHGIEVWKPFSRFKNQMLHSCDQVVAVSEFTRQQLIKAHGLDAKKVKVINNCLDPFLEPPSVHTKQPTLLAKYGLHKDDVVLFTLTRLAGTERHKGYDKVISAMADVQAETGKNIIYLIAGKYTDEEASHIQELATAAGVAGKVILTGFVPEADIAAHFEMADVYVMPSSKEGFGIVFIEAMYYGLPVIAGNTDGSVDALANGELGVLVNPDDEAAISEALIQIIRDRQKFVPDYRLLQDKFGYQVYRKKWEAGLLAF